MAKRPPPGTCVHCLRYFEKLTWDHGIPESWYPRGVVSAKVKAPSCRQCQQRLALVEHSVLVPIALCLDPSDPLANGVPQAVWRALDPNQAAKPGMSQAQIQRERRAREKLRADTKARLFQPTPKEYRCAIPGFGLADAKGGLTAIKGPHDSELQSLGEKFTRVALWAMRDRHLIQPCCRIRTHVVHASDIPDIEATIRGGDSLDMFPGIRITVRTASDDERAHLCMYELWGRLKLFVSVVPKETDDGEKINTCPPEVIPDTPGA